MMVQLAMGLMRGLAHLPLPVVRALGAVLGVVLWAAAGARRRIVGVNLALCFPEWGVLKRWRMGLGHFVRMGQAITDRAWLWHAPLSVVQARLQWQGDVQALRGAGPVVLFAPHFVGLDAGGMAVLLQVLPKPVAFIYVAQSNPALERWVRAGRERTGNARAHFRHQGMRQILVGLKRGDWLHLSPDMDFNRTESIFVPFMGVQAATVPSLSRLAKAAGAAVLPVVTRMTPGGYSVHVGQQWADFPSDDAQADTARMNEELAHWVRAMPAQYHWAHRRFKTRPEGQPSVY